MQWDRAIKYSQKSFLISCVVINSLELLIYFYREIQLYDGEDVFDYFEKRLKERNNEPIKFHEIEDNFMCAFHIMNSPEKRKEIDKYMYENRDENKKINSVNLYKFFRDNKKYF